MPEWRRLGLDVDPPFDSLLPPRRRRHAADRKDPAMLTSLIRTVVPLVVGWLIAQPVVGAAGVTEEQATTAVSALVTVVYYAAARAAEHYVSPKFGWLLGKASAPAYGPPAD